MKTIYFVVLLFSQMGLSEEIGNSTPKNATVTAQSCKATLSSATRTTSFAELLNDDLLKPPPKFVDATTADARIGQVFAHQNLIRGKGRAPLIPTEALDNAKSFYHMMKESQWPVGPIFTPSKSEWFVAYGKSDGVLVFPRWDDTYFLNFAYEFHGAVLKRAIPIAQYYFERYEGPTITFFRSMSDKEFTQWELKDFTSLRAYEKAWGYRIPIVHLALERPWSATQNNHRVLRYEIPTNILLEWAKNNEIGIGMMDRQSREYEIVIPHMHWEELVQYAKVIR